MSTRPVSTDLPLPPGPKGRQLRHAMKRARDFQGLLDELHREHGDIVRFELPTSPCCAVFTGDLAREVLTTQERWFRPFYPPSNYDLLTHYFLQTSHGDDHRRRREIMLAGYAEERMRACANLILDNVDELIGRCTPNREVDMIDELERFSWRCMLDLVLGREPKLDPELGRSVLSAMKQDLLLGVVPFKEVVVKLPLPFNRRVRDTLKALDEVTYPAIERAKDPAHDGHDLISHLVRTAADGSAHGLYETDLEVRDEAYGHLCAAIDAPVGTLTWGIHLVARHPDVRGRVEHELDDILGDRPIEAGDLRRLPYLRAIFREILRFEPPAYAMPAREALEDRVLGGYLIPKGTMTIVGAHVIQRRPEHWEDADEFRPERWLGVEAGDGMRPEEGYMPFGVEPRGCRGAGFAAMMFTFALASLFRDRRLEPLSRRPPSRTNIGIGVRGAYKVRIETR